MNASTWIPLIAGGLLVATAGPLVLIDTLERRRERRWLRKQPLAPVIPLLRTTPMANCYRCRAAAHVDDLYVTHRGPCCRLCLTDMPDHEFADLRRT